ncbi:MAG TPA: tetratricopeptide repeat protein [Chthoniobacteraceae bacterium]|nr:tetratricopeptide repeat protein [Chthoniobacteraceae bacterium]
MLLNLIFGAVVLWGGRHDPMDPRLVHEKMAIDRLADAHYVFYSPWSHADLAKARPDLVAAANERAFARGVQSPAIFRQLDHQRQFDGVLLAGDPTTYEPLLKHLSESKDFVLTWLDNAALVFRRYGAKPWREADLNTTAAGLKGENKARFLAGAATRLIAIGQIDMAKRALDQAAPNGGKLPEYWTTLGLFDGKIDHWKEALDALNQALALNSDFTPALTTKAQILFGARRYDEALDIMDKVVAEHPNDPSMLFLHATISHEAHAYQREIAALKRLIGLAESQGVSATGYHIYLGQAYAQTGDAMLSLIEFKKVLDSDDASPEQRIFAQDCMNKIADKTGQRISN